MANLSAFYPTKSEPYQSCLLALQSIILQIDSNITETTKYGMPCFCYYKKAFCYLWMDKERRELYVLFVEGNHLSHPNLETGSRKRMKIFGVNPNLDLPTVALQEVLKNAVYLYKSGVIKIRKT
jgi:hypothetical protein